MKCQDWLSEEKKKKKKKKRQNKKKKKKNTIWPRHGKTCFQAYADSEGPDQPKHAVSSEHSLSANRIVGHYRMYEWRANTRMVLCACAR